MDANIKGAFAQAKWGGVGTFCDIFNIAFVAKAPIMQALVLLGSRESRDEAADGLDCTYCVNFHVGEFASLSTMLDEQRQWGLVEVRAEI